VPNIIRIVVVYTDGVEYMFTAIARIAEKIGKNKRIILVEKKRGGAKSVMVTDATFCII
jgi:ribosomal protein L32E